VTVLAPYRDRLVQWLEADARRAQRVIDSNASRSIGKAARLP